MLTTAELAAHLCRITYRPGWAITVCDGRWEGQHVVIRADLPDAYHPDERCYVDIHSALPPMRDTGQFEEWLAWRLGRIELHEMREWLRRDGKSIYDPHAPYADRDEEPAPPRPVPSPLRDVVQGERIRWLLEHGPEGMSDDATTRMENRT